MVPLPPPPASPSFDAQGAILALAGALGDLARSCEERFEASEAMIRELDEDLERVEGLEFDCGTTYYHRHQISIKKALEALKRNG